MTSDRPFSRMVAAAEVPAEGSHVRFEADAGERAALARFLDVPDMAGFVADLTVRPWRKGGLMVEGTVSARLTRICVVSLEPFEASLNEPVEARYSAAPRAMPGVAGSGAAGEPRGSHAADLDAPDELEGGKADLGALAVEFAALGLDPYPRKPGVALEGASTGEAAPADSPFAVLGGRLGRTRESNS
jgi:hypothetical protein